MNSRWRKNSRREGRRIKERLKYWDADGVLNTFKSFKKTWNVASFYLKKKKKRSKLSLIVGRKNTQDINISEVCNTQILKLCLYLWNTDGSSICKYSHLTRGEFTPLSFSQLWGNSGRITLKRSVWTCYLCANLTLPVTVRDCMRGEMDLFWPESVQLCSYKVCQDGQGFQRVEEGRAVRRGWWEGRDSDRRRLVRAHRWDKGWADRCLMLACV